MSNRKTRACNILVVRALKTGEFVARSVLESIMLDSVYKSTAVSKTMGYVNDIKFYHGGRLEYIKNNKTVVAVKLQNAFEFNHETGFPLTKEESSLRATQLADFLKNLANETVSETVVETETVSEETLIVSQDETASMTSDSDIVMSATLETDDSSNVYETVSREEKALTFAEKMKAAKAAKKAKAA